MPKVVSIALCLLFCSAAASQPPPLPGETVDDVMNALKNNPSATFKKQGGWTIVESTEGDDLVMWSFTPEDHSAHPAVAKRRVFQKDGSWYIDMDIRCGASKSACDKLAEEFVQLNNQMRDYISQKKRNDS